MLSRLTDEKMVVDAIHRRQTIADGLADLNEDWLLKGHRVVLAEESGRHLESEQVTRLVNALRTVQVSRLVAISNDPLVLDDMAYGLDATEGDLASFSSEFSGINALLMPSEGIALAVLFSTDDFHLVAGSEDFVAVYGGDLKAAKANFVDFARGHFEVMRPILTKASHYMDWIDD
jgi:hypothetical protein